jgi:hypothetical protein
LRFSPVSYTGYGDWKALILRRLLYLIVSSGYQINVLLFNSNFFHVKLRILSFSILISLLCVACNQTADTLSEDTTPSLEGVWKLTEHYWINEYDDTVFVFPESEAYKIYLDGHVMWSGEPDPDSIEWYGFGTYELKGDTLIERLSVMSWSMQELMDFDDEAVLVVKFDEHNFKQYFETTWKDTIYHNTEIYVRVK